MSEATARRGDMRRGAGQESAQSEGPVVFPLRVSANFRSAQELRMDLGSSGMASEYPVTKARRVWIAGVVAAVIAARHRPDLCCGRHARRMTGSELTSGHRC